MALKNFKFGFGDGFQEVALPEEHILQVIEGNESEKITDVKAAVLKAMREPINSKPLQQCVNKGEKVAIVVSDIRYKHRCCAGYAPSANSRRRRNCLRAGSSRPH